MNKHLYKSKSNKKIAGVCAGVADYFGFDATTLRIIWALFSCFYGIGILVYLILAFALPEE